MGGVGWGGQWVNFLIFHEEGWGGGLGGRGVLGDKIQTGSSPLAPSLVLLFFCLRLGCCFVRHPGFCRLSTVFTASSETAVADDLTARCQSAAAVQPLLCLRGPAPAERNQRGDRQEPERTRLIPTIRERSRVIKVTRRQLSDVAAVSSSPEHNGAFVQSGGSGWY